VCSFTAKVVDSTGTAAGTTTANCTITVLPPPIMLTCPAATAQVGVAYSSALVATGGTPPYTFSISSGSLPPGLTLNTTTGAITGTPTTAGTYSFTGMVVDSSGKPAGTTTANCTITVTAAPTATCAVINAVQGTPITPVTLVGSGGAGGPYTFTATGLPAGLSISTSGTISGTPTVSGTFSYTVTIADKNGNKGTVNCSVTVYPPIASTCVVINAIQGVAITPVTMTASGGAGAPYTFSATGLPAGLTIASNGTISGTPTVTGTFSYTVTITDKNGNKGTFNCSVTVNIPPTSTCVVISAVQGVAITPVTLVGTGGAGGPYTFTATGLPAGLTISSTGTISGTPTVSGTFSYTVTITDSAGNKGTINCSVTVNGPPTSTCAVISAVQGVAITPVTLVGSGGTGGPYTFTATGLPAGLTISSTGTISGTPTLSGTFSYTVTITDKSGNKGTINCSVTVNPPIMSTCVVINAIQGVAITPVTMTASGGAGAPYTFTATGLPAGLAMASNGTISGTPTVSGTFSYTVTITDKAGNTGTFHCSVTVNPPIMSTCVVINAIQGVAITPVTMTASGGAGAPYTFTATGLPAGLTMASNGTISGTPTVSGTFSYTVTITDKAGNVGTFNCSVTVNPPIMSTCVVINAIQGVAITSVTMTASGGAGAPYTFTATGLPAGLTMASNGTISGTPTVSGTFSYTVTITDKAGNKGTFNCSVTVYPPIMSTCVVINAIQGGAITPVTMTASGGAGAPYTFTATGLPAGLTMASNGTISGTPTVSGTFSYTVTITDKAGNKGTFNCSVTVNPPPTATCVVINAVQGVAITPVTLVGSGGAGGPYTFSATGLPAGLSISTSGTISGTPTVFGTFSYTVTITDKNGNKGTLNCSVTVIPPPIMLACAAVTAQVGVAYNSALATAGGLPPFTFSISSGSLPPGLTLNPTTGAITGTPTTAGTFSFTAKVVDSSGLATGTATANCTITVAPPCLLTQLGPAGSQNFSILGLQGSKIQLSSGPLKVNGNVGIGVNGLIHLSGGSTQPGTLYADPSATVQIDGGSSFGGGVVNEPFTAIQNAALALAAQAAALPATQTFTQIQNATTILGNGGQNVIAVTGTFHLSGAKLTISGGANDTFIINVYQGLQMDGGASIVLSGVSPTQVLFNFIGTQQFQTSGNADTAGIFLGTNGSQQVQINGGVHSSVFIFASTNFSFQSNPQVNTIQCAGPQALALACPETTAALGTAYSSALIATGGVAPYTFSISAGSLPPGLMLNTSTGAITGTPTTAGSYSFTAKVVDSSGSSANTTTSNCTITVTTAACVIPPSGTAIGGSPVSWNGFSAPAGSVVWINAHIGTPSGLLTNQITTVDFTGVSLVVNATTYALPNGHLVFNPAAPTIATTVVNADGSWTTTLNPSSLADEIFFVGQAIPVDANMENGGGGNTGSTLSFTTSSNSSTLSFQWQWGAAVYTSWPGNAAANIEPVHAAQHAGAPLNTAVEADLIQGPRGGGGSNFTGSWSGTGTGTCP